MEVIQDLQQHEQLVCTVSIQWTKSAETYGSRPRLMEVVRDLRQHEQLACTVSIQRTKSFGTFKIIVCHRPKSSETWEVIGDYRGSLGTYEAFVHHKSSFATAPHPSHPKSHKTYKVINDTSQVTQDLQSHQRLPRVKQPPLVEFSCFLPKFRSISSSNTADSDKIRYSKPGLVPGLMPPECL